MSFRLKSKIVPLLVLYGLLIGAIIPVSALDTANSESYNVFEKLTVDVAVDQKYVPGEILVKFNPGVSEEKIKNINTGNNAQVTYTSPYAEFKILKIPPTKTVEEMVEIYSKNPNVEYAVPNAITNAFMVPNDPLYKYQWNFKAFETGVGGGINLEPSWDVSTGSGVIVAVLDTGVAYEDYSIYRKAPDLVNTKFVSGYDFVNNDTHPNDDNSHGTHVAGTIVQSTNDNYGVAGVAYGCSIMPVKVLDKEGSGSLQQLIDAIYYATDNNADVISMSLGFSPGYYPGEGLDNALEYAYNNGVTIVAAAGNDGTGTVSYPAANDKCIAVGATRYDGTRPDYSNYGNALDIMAPGGDLNVDQNGDGYGDGILQNTFDPTTKDPEDFGFWFFTGTSMATPHVSSVAALLIAKGAKEPDQVRTAIQNSATDLGTSGWDPEYGYGLINAKAALDYIQGQTTVNNPPVAEAGDPYFGTTGTAIAFDGSGSYDSDGSIISYYWDFDGDGSTDSYEENPTWIYEKAGTYTVTLTVTDNDNAVGTDTATVTVTDPASGSTIHVSEVSVETISRVAGKNTFVSARAVVTILDSNDAPVEGATVSGYWSGATRDLDSAVTNSTGEVTVYSDEVKYKSGTLTFTFTVNDVSHSIPWDGNATSGTRTYTKTV
jgi:serine protease